MNKLLNQLNERLKTLNYETLYPGFKQYSFALYDQEKVYFLDKDIPWDQRFMGNTAIKYEDEFIAIWNLQYSIDDLDVFTSKIVHEMFHVHQFTCGETRFPNEIAALHYTYNNENISMKYDETQALLNGDIQSFIKKRNYRHTLYKNEVTYENHIEQAEGSARYVELQALKQLNESKYENELMKTRHTIQQITSYLPIRTLSYEIGAFLFIELRKQHIPYNESFSIKETIFEQINKDNSIEMYQHNRYLTPFIDEYYQKLTNTIKKIKEESTNQFEFINLTGLDPMNTFAYENDIYYKYFVRVELPNKEMKMIMKEAVSTVDKANNISTLFY